MTLQLHSLDTYVEETLIQEDICTPLFTAALLTIAKTWKQPKCSSTDEWIKKMWFIHNRILLSHKKNEIMPTAATLMDLQIIILSDVRKRKTNVT